MCFRCENTVISVELSAHLKIALHLLLLSPLATQAVVCSSVWKGTCESLSGGAEGREEDVNE